MLAVLLNFFIGVMASTLPAMFPTHIRYSALASAFNVSVLIAGLTPAIVAWLVESTQNLYMPAYYLMVIAVVGLVTGVTMKETANKPLRGAAPAASDLEEARSCCRSTMTTSSRRSRTSMPKSPSCKPSASVWCSSIRELIKPSVPGDSLKSRRAENPGESACRFRHCPRSPNRHAGA